MQYRLEISRLAILLSGFELNFLRRADCRFVQPMTEAMHYLHHANLSGRSEHDIKQNLALNFELSTFISVDRAGLECNLSR